MMWQTLWGYSIYQDEMRQVWENTFYRWLTFSNNHTTSIQTVLNRYVHRQTVLTYIKAITLACKHLPANTCLLGLGGGGVVHTIHHYLKKHALTIIEYDPTVIQLAQTYFYLNKLTNANVFCQDARDFLQSPKIKQHHQHLIIDLADFQGFPENCAHSDFFYNCYVTLPVEGTLSVNMIQKEEHLKLLSFIQAHFGRANTLSIPIPHTTNVIVIGYKYTSIRPWLQRLLELKKLTRVIWDPEFGYMGQ